MVSSANAPLAAAVAGRGIISIAGGVLDHPSPCWSPRTPFDFEGQLCLTIMSSMSAVFSASRGKPQSGHEVLIRSISSSTSSQMPVCQPAQRSSIATPRSAELICTPHPRQVFLPHWLQGHCTHIIIFVVCSLKMRSGRASSESAEVMSGYFPERYSRRRAYCTSMRY